MEALLGAGSVVFGMVITYFTFVRNRDKDVKQDAEDGAVIRTKLDSIGKGVDDIRIDLKANEKQMSRMNEQLIRVDESTKSAHKRIDKLEGVRKHG
ncbi:MAG TPA: hypothetical protein VIG73_08400 [Cerasibacillus sp.]|uniref:hypothetical protein n=1 Tax=Cerasibacillus sp. TaxID=2498711 RepID=UPI002F41BD92